MGQKKTNEEYINELIMINSNIKVLGQYTGNHNTIHVECLICGHNWHSDAANLLQGHGCQKCAGKILKTQEIFEKELFEINPNIKVIGKYINNHTKIKCECLICGNIWNPTPKELICEKLGCNVCSGHKVLKGINDLWTTIPEVAKLLKYPEHGYVLSKGSHFNSCFICPDCKNETFKIIKDVVKNGFSCKKCGDRISYPEKFMYNVLSQLDISFETQKIYDWAKNKRYDFYLSDYNCIIETHGGQHYGKKGFSTYGGKTPKEEQENDILKENLAKENGITNYISINSSESNLEYIKNSIINSQMSTIFNLTDFDWKLCHINSLKSFVKESCYLWNSGLTSTIEIGNELKLSCDSIKKYLLQGSSLGWCNYNTEYGKKLSTLKIKKLLSKQVVCLTTNKTFNSITSAAKFYNLSSISRISSCCNHKKNYKSAGKLPNGTKLCWMFYNEYLELHK